MWNVQRKCINSTVSGVFEYSWDTDKINKELIIYNE